MFSIRPCALPDDALLNVYLNDGVYVDCYSTAVTGSISHAQFVNAFYTTWVFKLERWILKWAFNKPSTDAQAKQLADGASDAFAAWTIESRGDDQLLLCDYVGRTRSWLMVASATTDTGPRTRLYFGSAVVPVVNPKTGESSLGGGFGVLLGFHKLYSRILLSAARSRLEALQP